MSDLNDLIVAAYTKTCEEHKCEYNVLMGCLECLTKLYDRIKP